MSFQESLKILLLLFTTLQNIFFEQTPLFYFTNVKILKVQCTCISICKRNRNNNNGIKANKPPSNRVD